MQHAQTGSGFMPLWLCQAEILAHRTHETYAGKVDFHVRAVHSPAVASCPSGCARQRFWRTGRMDSNASEVNSHVIIIWR